MIKEQSASEMCASNRTPSCFGCRCGSQMTSLAGRGDIWGPITPQKWDAYSDYYRLPSTTYPSWWPWIISCHCRLSPIARPYGGGIVAELFPPMPIAPNTESSTSYISVSISIFAPPPPPAVSSPSISSLHIKTTGRGFGLLGKEQLLGAATIVAAGSVIVGVLYAYGLENNMLRFRVTVTG